MSHNEAALYHSNRYNAQAACEHCEGIIRHERWCQTLLLLTPQQVRRLGTMSEGHDAPPTCSQANT